MIQNKDENQNERDEMNIINKFATEECYNPRMKCNPGNFTQFEVSY